MRAALWVGALVALTACGSVHRDTGVAMRADPGFDPATYVGRWYEIARFPVVFQRGCTATTADYAVREDGTLSVTNRCRADTPDGPERSISGTAEVVGPGQLRVRLGLVPFSAPYWVLWVADDGSVAVVGVPSGRAGWVLARTPEIPARRWDEARAVLAGNGYDVTRLIVTPH